MALTVMHDDGDTVDINMDDLMFHETMCGATRYYLGRHTIAVHGFANWLRDHIMELPEKTRFVIWRDIARWTADHAVYEFASVDDAEPWWQVVRICEKDDPTLKESMDYSLIEQKRHEMNIPEELYRS